MGGRCVLVGKLGVVVRHGGVFLGFGVFTMRMVMGGLVMVVRGRMVVARRGVVMFDSRMIFCHFGAPSISISGL